MGAIWGIICKDSVLYKKYTANVECARANYKIDRMDSVFFENGQFVCGHQFFTKESISDISPISDGKVIFAADCILFNRDCLFERLDNENIDRDKIGDAHLAYLMYQKYGKGFVTLLRGNFAIAIYCLKTKRLLLYSDHLFSRYITYSVTEEGVWFGTTCDVFNTAKKRVDEDFIAHAYQNKGPLIFGDNNRTQYVGIKRLKPATIVSVNVANGKVEEETYWNASNIKPKKRYKSDGDCKQAFLEAYRNSVAGMLRSSGKTGITLSGGLDSSSVAALAAIELGKRNEKLYSYTQVPVDGFVSDRPSHMSVDESNAVRAACRMYENIIPSFVSSEDKNCFDYVKMFTELYQIPVKPCANLPHIHRMLTKASEDGCRIVLGGGNGNSTVSYGQVQDILALDYSSGRFVSFWRDLSSLCRVNSESRKVFLTMWLKNWFSSLFSADTDQKCLLKKEIIESYNLSEDDKKRRKAFGTTYVKTYKQSMRYRFDLERFAQYSYFRTIQSLKYGVMLLDPTMTVEIVEFCFALDLRYYFKNGIDRSLIRVYMGDLLPKEITDVRAPFGLQAADLAYCINRDFDRVKDSIYDALSSEELNKYIDKKTIESCTRTLQENEGNNAYDVLWETILLTTLSYFLNMNV